MRRSPRTGRCRPRHQTPRLWRTRRPPPSPADPAAVIARSHLTPPPQTIMASTCPPRQLRVPLTAVAYVLMQELRLRAARTTCARAQSELAADPAAQAGRPCRPLRPPHRPASAALDTALGGVATHRTRARRDRLIAAPPRRTLPPGAHQPPEPAEPPPPAPRSAIAGRPALTSRLRSRQNQSETSSQPRLRRVRGWNIGPHEFSRLGRPLTVSDPPHPAPIRLRSPQLPLGRWNPTQPCLSSAC